MRNINELLQLTLKKAYNISFGGLCILIIQILQDKEITIEEYVLLENYIKIHKPFGILFRTDAYYWSMNKRKPRIRYLKKHIKRTSRNIKV